MSAVINLTTSTNTEELTFIENNPGKVVLNLTWRRPSLFAPLMSTESFIVSTKNILYSKFILCCMVYPVK